jgi:hypothetical protein
VKKLTDLEYQELMKRSYNKDNKEGNEFYFEKDLFKRNSKWEVLKVLQNDKTGFYGVAFLKPETNDVVIATRGSDEFKDFALDNSDLSWYTSQVMDSFDLLEQTGNELQARGGDYRISFTGHSLGGKLAQTLLYESIESSSNINVPAQWLENTEAVIYNAAKTQNLPFALKDMSIGPLFVVPNVIRRIMGSKRPVNSRAFEEYPVRHYITEKEVLNTYIAPLGGQHLGKQYLIPMAHEETYIDKKGLLSIVPEGMIILHNYPKDVNSLPYFMNENGMIQLDGVMNRTQASTDDVLHGYDHSNYEDIIYGGPGKDTLYGKSGRDQLLAGTGDGDKVYGGNDGDLYFFDQGDGHDHFTEDIPRNINLKDYGKKPNLLPKDKDRIRIVGYKPEDIQLIFSHGLLAPLTTVDIAFKGTTDKISLSNSASQFEVLELADGNSREVYREIDFQSLIDYCLKNRNQYTGDVPYNLEQIIFGANQAGVETEVSAMSKEVRVLNEDPYIPGLDARALPEEFHAEYCQFVKVDVEDENMNFLVQLRAGSREVLGHFIHKTLSDYLAELSSKARDKAQEIGAAIAEFSRRIQDGWDTLVSGIKRSMDALKNAGIASAHAAMQFRDKMMQAITDFCSWVEDGIRRASSATRKAMVRAVDKVTTWSRNMKEEMTTTIGGLKDGLKRASELTRQGIKSLSGIVARRIYNISGGYLMVNLDRLSHLQIQIKRIEDDIMSITNSIASDAERVASEVSRSYSEPSVRSQVRSLQKSIADVRSRSKKVASELERTVRSIQQAKDKYGSIERMWETRLAKQWCMPLSYKI